MCNMVAIGLLIVATGGIFGGVLERYNNCSAIIISGLTVRDVVFSQMEWGNRASGPCSAWERAQALERYDSSTTRGAVFCYVRWRNGVKFRARVVNV